MKYWTFLFAVFLLTACQNQSSNDANAGDVQQSDDGQFARDKPSGQSNHNWAFLTNKLFHYKAKVVVGKPVSKADYAGKWIDLEDDGTFETGTYQKRDFTGEWTYEHGDGILTLYPDPKTEKNTQWRVKYSDDVVILVGTAKYEDNATQIQLVRNAEKPAASR